MFASTFHFTDLFTAATIVAPLIVISVGTRVHRERAKRGVPGNAPVWRRLLADVVDLARQLIGV